MINFPDAPTLNQVVTVGNATWQWDGTKWVSYAGMLYIAQTGDTPPASPSPVNGNLWYDTVGANLYVYFNDGTSSQWVPSSNQLSVNPVPISNGGTGAITNLLALDNLSGASGATSGPLTRSSVGTWAVGGPTPVDMLAFNGMQVNGGMDISQELGTTGRSTDGYVVDAWRVDHNGTMVHFAAPVATIAPGFSNHLAVNITTAEASIAGPDYMLSKPTGWMFRRYNGRTYFQKQFHTTECCQLSVSVRCHQHLLSYRH